MPRTPRNPGSGKKPYNGPAQGPGWGGPAQGAGNGSPGSLSAPQWPVGQVVNPGAIPGPKALHRQQQAEAVLDRLHAVAMGQLTDAMPVEVMAQKEFLNRVHGMPTQAVEQKGEMKIEIVHFADNPG